MTKHYPPNWPEIATRVKERAGWRCENCGHPHDPQGYYCLTVHHINGDPSDCRERNLVALCQRCHLSIQAKYKPGQMMMFAPPWERGTNENNG